MDPGCCPRPVRVSSWLANGPAAPPRLDRGLTTEIPLTAALGSSVRIDCLNAIGPTDAWVTLPNSPQLEFDLTAFH